MVYAVSFGLALTLAAGTVGSRFYILPTFTTFFGILLPALMIRLPAGKRSG